MATPHITESPSVLPNHKLFNSNKEDEKESYYYSLLLLCVPFRNESDLIKDGERAKDAFQRHMEHNDALNTHSETPENVICQRECAENQRGQASKCAECTHA